MMGHTLERARLVNSQDRAEWERLHAALNNGPGRRLQQDVLLGREPAKVDVQHVARLRGLMRALERAAGEPVATVPGQRLTSDVPTVVS
jgi:hypothetical protein